jgi:exodeoxyribonuclease V gamma subunit
LSGRELNSGFMVIHGNQPELLRQLLVHWFQQHPLRPLEDETLLVQSNGIAQWLKLALAGEGQHGLGIAAAFDMLLPSRFVWRVYRAVLGEQAVPERSPFDKNLLIWRLLRLLPELLDKPGYEPLQAFLADDQDDHWRKRYQLAQKIADLFDQYQVYRADWLTAWAQGQNVLIDSQHEAQALAPEQHWQPLLWRALLADVGADDQAADTGRAAVHQRFLETVERLSQRPAGLPRRISVFGLSSLPRQSLEVLLAISRFTQVLLCVHNPCEYFWTDLLAEKDHARRALRNSRRHARKAGWPAAGSEASEQRPRIDAAELHLHAQPLLAAWGRQGRDYLALLDELDQPENYRQQFERIGEHIDLFASHGDESLLQQLQEDIRQLRSPAESRDRWPVVDPARDRSLRFHVAHSMQREVEILQDQLLAAFAADPTLRPRDVIVMVPDIDAFAPHIDAVFGQLERDDARYLPYSIADRAQRRQTPLAFALEFLLGLPEPAARLTVSDLFDLLDVPALRQRFKLMADDLPLLQQWIRQSNIRWGLDAAHRAQFMPDLSVAEQAQNTWQQGLKRMLLGYAMGGNDDGDAGESCWRDIEAYAEVSGLSAALLGPLAQLLNQLEQLKNTLSSAATAADWSLRLQALLTDFFQVDTPQDQQLLQKLQSSLSDWRSACEAAGLLEPLPLAVVREHWLTQLDQSGLSRPYMIGGLTFATLMPMRAIPYRMVCLLGMNDGEFPRNRPPLDFDLMARDMRPGDRSRREDDRYLFLEALLSAREQLHISWVGRSIHDNTPRAPSVLVSQLRDHLSACWRLAAADECAGTLLAALTVEHRLQPFSSDYFGQTAATSALFTYAHEWERQAVVEQSAGAVAADLQRLPFPAEKTQTAQTVQIAQIGIGLRQLAMFLKNPVESFYRERLNIRFDHALTELAHEDQEPFALDGLQQWSLQQQLIQARLDALQRGQDETQVVEQALARIRRCGELPIGSAATLCAEALREPLERLFDLRAKALATWSRALEDQTFSYRRHPTGADQAMEIVVSASINALYCDDATGRYARIELSASNLLAEKKYRRDKLLAAWVTHLAAHLSLQAPVTTLLIGTNGQVPLQPLSVDLAREHFDRLIDCWLQGQCEPLPLAAKTGFAWLEKQGQPEQQALALADCRQPALAAARSAYEGGYRMTGEVEQSASLQQAYPDFSRLWAQGRFSQLCAELYAPLMMHVGAGGEKKQ